jgi:hypothetical protein
VVLGERGQVADRDVRRGVEQEVGEQAPTGHGLSPGSSGAGTDDRGEPDELRGLGGPAQVVLSEPAHDVGDRPCLLLGEQVLGHLRVRRRRAER